MQPGEGDRVAAAEAREARLERHFRALGVVVEVLRDVEEIGAR